jgi:hypothetical protein
MDDTATSSKLSGSIDIMQGDLREGGHGISTEFEQSSAEMYYLARAWAILAMWIWHRNLPRDYKFAYVARFCKMAGVSRMKDILDPSIICRS